MKIENCTYKGDIKSCFYDGKPETAKFIEENFSEFEYTNWTDEEWIDGKWVKKKGKFLIYFCNDGDYQNVVPNGVHIVQYDRLPAGHLTFTEWFTPEEFKNNFDIK